MMSESVSQLTVAVVTSTIGRVDLERAILSVQAQTYPCKHYVFVDGQQYKEQAKNILEKYPDVVATYLPMNTGANGWTNSSINAIAPFLIKADIICYLDDDNWYDQNHIEEGIRTLLNSDADYAYSLRKLYDENGDFICEDIIESIGNYESKLDKEVPFGVKLDHRNGEIVQFINIVNKKHHIDTNCYMMRHTIAKEIAPYWHSGIANDTNVFNVLNKKNIVGECTKNFSVNYILDIEKQHPTAVELFKEELGFSQEMALKLGYELIRLMNYKHFELLNGKNLWD